MASSLVVAAPPLRGPDETTHFLRACGVGTGDIGAPVRISSRPSRLIATKILGDALLRRMPRSLKCSVNRHAAGPLHLADYDDIVRVGSRVN